MSVVAPATTRAATVVRRSADAGWGLAAVLGVLAVLAVAAAPLLDLHVSHVTSGSMSPALEPGDLVVAHRVDVRDVAVGDVVGVVTPRGTRVMHRVVSTGPPGLVLRGDANAEPDPAAYDVPRADRLVLAVPWVGALVAVVGAVPSWQLGAGLAGLAVLGWGRRREP